MALLIVGVLMNVRLLGDLVTFPFNQTLLNKDISLSHCYIFHLPFSNREI